MLSVSKYETLDKTDSKQELHDQRQRCNLDHGKRLTTAIRKHNNKGAAGHFPQIGATAYQEN